MCQIPKPAVEAVSELLERETGVPVYTGFPQPGAIPRAAVEVATNTLFGALEADEMGWATRDAADEVTIDVQRFDLAAAMQSALEAAAPHMHGSATTLEELDALPEGSIVRTQGYSLYVKDQIKVGGISWWVTTNEQYDFRSSDIELPATVLYEPSTRRG